MFRPPTLTWQPRRYWYWQDPWWKYKWSFRGLTNPRKQENIRNSDDVVDNVVDVTCTPAVPKAKAYDEAHINMIHPDPRYWLPNFRRFWLYTKVSKNQRIHNYTYQIHNRPLSVASNSLSQVNCDINKLVNWMKYEYQLTGKWILVGWLNILWFIK